MHHKCIIKCSYSLLQRFLNCVDLEVHVHAYDDHICLIASTQESIVTMVWFRGYDIPDSKAA